MLYEISANLARFRIYTVSSAAVSCEFVEHRDAGSCSDVFIGTSTASIRGDVRRKRDEHEELN